MCNLYYRVSYELRGVLYVERIHVDYVADTLADIRARGGEIIDVSRIGEIIDVSRIA